MNVLKGIAIWIGIAAFITYCVIYYNLPLWAAPVLVVGVFGCVIADAVLEDIECDKQLIAEERSRGRWVAVWKYPSRRYGPFIWWKSYEPWEVPYEIRKRYADNESTRP